MGQSDVAYTCRRKFVLLVFKRRYEFRREDNEGSLVGPRKYAF
jgi:hypothetical protein